MDRGPCLFLCSLLLPHLHSTYLRTSSLILTFNVGWSSSCSAFKLEITMHCSMQSRGYLVELDLPSETKSCNWASVLNIREVSNVTSLSIYLVMSVTFSSTVLPRFSSLPSNLFMALLNIASQHFPRVLVRCFGCWRHFANNLWAETRGPWRDCLGSQVAHPGCLRGRHFGFSLFFIGFPYY